jgi:hypothetical protein
VSSRETIYLNTRPLAGYFAGQAHGVDDRPRALGLPCQLQSTLDTSYHWREGKEEVSLRVSKRPICLSEAALPWAATDDPAGSEGLVVIKHLVAAVAIASTCLAVTSVRAADCRDSTTGILRTELFVLMVYQGYRYDLASNTWSPHDIYNAQALKRAAEMLREWRISCPTGR